jgi:hypothetical protein
MLTVRNTAWSICHPVDARPSRLRLLTRVEVSFIKTPKLRAIQEIVEEIEGAGPRKNSGLVRLNKIYDKMALNFF